MSSDILSAISVINSLLATAMNLFKQASIASGIIEKRLKEGRESWTEEEKAAVDAALAMARKHAKEAVGKL